ncbi:MAG: hypothetical protein JWM41_1383 [Gemmatimonadetes bacterium]|nr:hypothetical protein [Gemmatimonadota bacterium]
MNLRLLALAATVSACASTTDVGVPLSTFGESAATSILASGNARAVYATLTVTNGAAAARTLSWGYDCAGAGALRVRAYRVAGGTRAIAWDSDRLPRMLGCLTQLAERTLGPGEATAIHQSIAVASILGDSLAAGPYELTVTAETTPPLPLEVVASTLTLTNAVIDPPSVNLSGTWTGSASGVSMSIDLTWTADSVTGAGTYNASASNALGCGGGNLRGTGTVTYAGARAKDHVQGGMRFDAIWVPPFSGVLVDANTLAGAFMSIDAGPCPITLTKSPQR